MPEKFDIANFKSIESDPQRRGGKPVLKGTRFTAAQVLSQIAAGDSVQDLVDNFDFEAEQITSFLRELADFLNTD